MSYNGCHGRRTSSSNPASEQFKDESTVNVRVKKNPEAL